MDEIRNALKEKDPYRQKYWEEFNYYLQSQLGIAAILLVLVNLIGGLFVLSRYLYFWILHGYKS